MPKNEFFKRLLFGVWKNIFYRMYGIFFIKPEKDYVNITIFLKTRCGLRQVDMLSNFYNTYGCKYIRKISWVYQISPQPLPPPPPRHPALTSRCVKKKSSCDIPVTAKYVVPSISKCSTSAPTAAISWNLTNLSPSHLKICELRP